MPTLPSSTGADTWVEVIHVSPKAVLRTCVTAGLPLDLGLARLLFADIVHLPGIRGDGLVTSVLEVHVHVELVGMWLLAIMFGDAIDTWVDLAFPTGVLGSSDVSAALGADFEPVDL